MGRALGLLRKAHLRLLNSHPQKILIKHLKSKSITQFILTHGLSRRISNLVVKIYTRLTHLKHRGNNSTQEPPVLYSSHEMQVGTGQMSSLVTHRARSST